MVLAPLPPGIMAPAVRRQSAPYPADFSFVLIIFIALQS